MKGLTEIIKTFASTSEYRRLETVIKINGKEYQMVCYRIPGVGGSIIRIDLKEVKE